MEEKLVYDDFSEEFRDWLSEDEPEPDYGPEVKKAREEMTEFYEGLMKNYEEDEENSLPYLLAEDDELQEELVDRLTLAELMEEAGDTPVCDVEKVYLSLIDICFELAKIVHPMAGFGADRLNMGLGILKSFEEEYWPLLTRVTKQNAKAFYHLIPDEHYDDILEGRKHAIGAVRMSTDRNTTGIPAGVAVYHIEKRLGNMVNLDWIYVAREYRQRGIANMLMAELLGYTLQTEDPVLTFRMNMPSLEKDEEKKEYAILEEFLDSWKFDYSMGVSDNFYIDLSKQMKNPSLNGDYRGVKSLSELGAEGERMLKKFLKRRGEEGDDPVRSTSYGFFDPEMSCAIEEKGEIRAVLLLHRLANGTYRYEGLKLLPGCDPDVVIKLIRFAYLSILEREEGKSFVFGIFESEEAFERMQKIFPEAQTMIQYRGMLMPLPTDQIVTTEDWEMLRREAGYAEETVPE